MINQCLNFNTKRPLNNRVRVRFTRLMSFFVPGLSTLGEGKKLNFRIIDFFQIFYF